MIDTAGGAPVIRVHDTGARDQTVRLHRRRASGRRFLVIVHLLANGA